MANLFMTVLDAVTPPIRTRIVDALGEPLEAIVRAITALAGGVIAGLIALCAAPAGAGGVLKAIRGSDKGLLKDASSLLEGDWRGAGSNGVLGERSGPLAEACAVHAGIRPDSARALLTVTEPLVLAAIAHSGVASDEAGLRSFLRSVEPEATRLAPRAAGGAPPAAHGLLAEPDASSATDSKGRPWWLWLLVALIAVFALVALLRR